MKNSLKASLIAMTKRREFIAFVGLAVIFIAFSFGSENFCTLFNIMSVLRQASINSVLAVGMTFVIISGGIDLSVSSIVSLSGTVAAITMVNGGMGVLPGLLVALLIGLLVGAVNGVVISRLSVPPIIATLGSMTVASGLALAVTGGYSVSGLPSGFAVFGRGNLGFLPVPVLIVALMYLIGHVILQKTKFGASVFGVGGNEEAARLAGISVEKTKIGVYMLSGLMAAIGGIILASRLDSGQPMAGDGLELNAIAAVVIGGASVNGGVGGVVGSLIGALIMSVLSNGFDLIGVGRFYQMIFTGIVLIFAVAIQKKSKQNSL